MAKEIKKENAQNVAEAVSKTDLFFQENKKTIIIAVAAVIVVALGIFLYQKFVAMPKKAEAYAQLYPAETLFQDQNFEQALNGDGNVLGFAQVIDEYGAKAGKAVYLYAGVCELQLGNYENALNYLKKYSGKEQILAARALACMGDAYVGLEQYDKALAYFLKAAKKSDDLFAADYLLKAGVVAEELGKTEEALGYYKQIKEQYPDSSVEYEKYISRIEAK